jgi:hypothetical protein
MDKFRMDVPIEAIRQHFALLWQNSSGALSCFVFNMHEMGYEELADAGRKTWFVPWIRLDDFVNDPVWRTGKRIAIVVCRGADGTDINPKVIITRKTVEDDKDAMM